MQFLHISGHSLRSFSLGGCHLRSRHVALVTVVPFANDDFCGSSLGLASALLGGDAACGRKAGWRLF